ncbi:ef hand domain-containing protein [Cystoisospora suis]|uniref:Ef hand domain-containing protein n=1 Tax=Cystoisospora suis TaxID=483139 RepID=A0A2C6KER9_9APIC|nr:ef hand domain-containing protein [Cystoisospora suis]
MTSSSSSSSSAAGLPLWHKSTPTRLVGSPPPLARRRRRSYLTGREIQHYLTPQEILPLRVVFSSLDQNQDGYLDAHDLQRSLYHDGVSISQQVAKEYVWEIDEDGDERLSFPDVAYLYVKATKSTMYSKTGEPKKLLNYLIYRLIDVERNGSLKPDDVYSYLCHIMTKDSASQNMKKIFGTSSDSSKISRVTLNQWLSLLNTSLWEADIPILDNSKKKPSKEEDLRDKNLSRLRNESVIHHKVDDHLDIRELYENMKEVQKSLRGGGAASPTKNLRASAYSQASGSSMIRNASPSLTGRGAGGSMASSSTSKKFSSSILKNRTRRLSESNSSSSSSSSAAGGEGKGWVIGRVETGASPPSKKIARKSRPGTGSSSQGKSLRIELPLNRER